MKHLFWKNPNYVPKKAPDAVYAIVAAAGSGSRMGLPYNKLFHKIGGLPVIVRTVAILDESGWIDGLVVTAAPEECEVMKALLAPYSFRSLMAIASGGSSRQHSVANGLFALKEWIELAFDSPILIHDGARCFVKPDVIGRVIGGIRRFGACGAAVPVKDTIKRAEEDGRVLETLDRSRLFCMQTPQGACWHLLDRAFRAAFDRLDQATDDLMVLEWSGQPVYLVMGDDHNIKLTTPEDCAYGSWLAERWPINPKSD